MNFFNSIVIKKNNHLSIKIFLKLNWVLWEPLEFNPLKRILIKIWLNGKIGLLISLWIQVSITEHFSTEHPLVFDFRCITIISHHPLFISRSWVPGGCSSTRIIMKNSGTTSLVCWWEFVINDERRRHRRLCKTDARGFVITSDRSRLFR